MSSVYRSVPAIFISLLLTLFASAQQTGNPGIWDTTSALRVSDRYDDIFFINADTGWACSLNYKSIYKTTDGGISWITTNAPHTGAYRDMAFLDAQTGFAGTLYPTTPDSVKMYRSNDGGINWQPVHNIPGPKNAGICGMQAINDSTLYAVGRYSGPAAFYKTTDRGTSWGHKDLSSLAGGLVDIYFFNADTGFAVGTTEYSSLYKGRGIILYTTDGGDNWFVKDSTTHGKEICWKIYFPSRQVGYISIQSFRSLSTDSQFCMKTIDGGNTWRELFVANPAISFDPQGIGFINENTGWVGGRVSSYQDTSLVYKTTDGGEHWSLDNWGNNLNRFRAIPGTGIAYFSGRQIYKFTCLASDFYDTVSICPGKTYTWRGHSFSAVGEYPPVFKESFCDSTLHLTLNHFPVQLPIIKDSSGVLRTDSYLHYQWSLNGVPLSSDTFSSCIPIANGSYTVQVVDTNHCLVQSSEYDVSFTIYYQPGGKEIVVGGIPRKTDVIVTNILGQPLLQTKATGSPQTIDLSFFPAGIYFLNGKKFIVR